MKAPRVVRHAPSRPGSRASAAVPAGRTGPGRRPWSPFFPLRCHHGRSSPGLLARFTAARRRALVVLVRDAPQAAGGAGHLASAAAGSGRDVTTAHGGGGVRNRSRSRASRACSGQRNGTTSPAAPAPRCPGCGCAGPPAVGLRGPGLGGLRGRAGALAPGHLGRPVLDRDRARRAAPAAPAAARASDCGASPRCRASRSRSAAVASQNAGTSPSGGRPVQRSACQAEGPRGPGRTPFCGLAGREWTTHRSLCFPPRARGLVAIGLQSRAVIPEPADLHPAAAVDLHVVGGQQLVVQLRAWGSASRTRPGPSRRRTACSGCAGCPDPTPGRTRRARGSARPFYRPYS